MITQRQFWSSVCMLTFALATGDSWAQEGADGGAMMAQPVTLPSIPASPPSADSLNTKVPSDSATLDLGSCVRVLARNPTRIFKQEWSGPIIYLWNRKSLENLEVVPIIEQQKQNRHCPASARLIEFQLRKEAGPSTGESTTETESLSLTPHAFLDRHDEYLGRPLSFWSAYKSLHTEEELITRSYARLPLYWSISVIDDNGGHWQSGAHRIEVVINQDISEFTLDVATQPGSFMLSRVPDRFLPGRDANSSGTSWVDSLGVAPIGVHVRYAPFPHIPEIGCGAMISVLALGDSGLVASEASTSSGGNAPVISPVGVMAGLDLLLPFSGGPHLHLLIGADYQALSTSEGYKGVPGWGISIVTPLFSTHSAPILDNAPRDASPVLERAAFISSAPIKAGGT